MNRARRNVDLIIALALLAAHAVAVLGYTSLFWGDNGRWLHEVERFAFGELPYRDFQWHYPPLALWVVGTAARLLGTDLAPVFLITSALAGLLVVAVVHYDREALGRSDPWVTAVCLVFAFAYAQTAGAPLPVGLYSPAALIGALCITIAAVGFLRVFASDGGIGGAWWIGLFAGLAVLAKQDFWIPAAYLVALSAIRFRRLTPVAVSGGTVALGASIVALTAGASVLRPLVGGFGHARIAGGMGFPSWERLTVELFAASLVVGFLAAMASMARRRLYVAPLLACAIVATLTGAIHVMVSLSIVPADLGPFPTPTVEAMAYHVREGNPLLRPALGWLRLRVVGDPIPFVLSPLLLAAMAVRWARLDVTRRSTVALLLGFAVALRARRAFEATEWFEFLLTLPVILASAELLFGLAGTELHRFRSGTLAVLTVMSVTAYNVLGRGAGTRRRFPGVAIARGTVHWAPNALGDYHRVRAAIDSIDPGGGRPVFAFGFTGGWNYFLNRRNPFPFTQNFAFSAFDADSVLITRPAGVILIDHSLIDGTSFTSLDIRLDRWEQARVPTPYPSFDRPRFDRLRDGCPRIALDSTAFRVYACP